MISRALQRYIEPYFRIKGGKIEHVRGHWWPSDRYFKGAQKDRKVRAWSRRRRRK